MERLLITKLPPMCGNRTCLLRSFKVGRSYCMLRGYVNRIPDEFRHSQCSCALNKILSRDYKAVRNHQLTTSHILSITSPKGSEWISLKPKQIGNDQRRENSSSSEENNDKEQSDYLNTAHWALAILLFSGTCYSLLVIPNGRLPRHISWKEFEEEYLMKGMVKNVSVYTKLFESTSEVPVVHLLPPYQPQLNNMYSNEAVIVDTNYKGEFQKKIRQFESDMRVPFSERILVKNFNRFYHGENETLYSGIMSSLILIMFLAAVTASFYARKIDKNYLKKLIDQMNNNQNASRSSAKTYEEKFQKPHEEKIKKTHEKEIKFGAKNSDGKKDENFAEMFSRSLFQDNRFKIKRGDLIMKDEISMKDVAGLHEPKVEILEFVDYVKNPDRFKTLGAKTPRGALLLGPPGCGKTLLAKALAAECEVPFFFIAASELIDMIVGVGAQRVRTLFKKARDSAPCIIYIDELDAIGMKRATSDRFTNQASNDKETTLNQLLAELDGMHSREGVIILASTNRADTLDRALLRPGRFDRHISIDLPTFKERIEHFDLYLSKLALGNPVSTYSTRLAQLTPGMSGADIAYICNEAAIHAARDSQKKVTAKDFEYAIERKMAGAAKATNTLGVHEKKVIAYHESGHALVGWLLEHTDALLKVTIVPRTSGVGGFAQYLPKENKMYSKEQLFDIMCMALGGRVAETVIFNHLSTGAQDDLRRVTKMAYAQIRNFGMSETFGLLSYPEDQYGLKPFSKKVSNMLDLEARQLVSKAYQHTEELLKNNKDKLHQLASLLLERETISAKDVEDLIGPPPFGDKQMIDPITFYDEELTAHRQENAKKEENTTEHQSN